jgi:hypothetical protein
VGGGAVGEPNVGSADPGVLVTVILCVCPPIVALVMLKGFIVALDIVVEPVIPADETNPELKFTEPPVPIVEPVTTRNIDSLTLVIFVQPVGGVVNLNKVIYVESIIIFIH